ncbi:unnamed protein product [Dovyalis caffra]|uniref:EF-hand domain-containing protein n=1 Tax=Dovyalis caffra TaxID=77055 RepID=A0AAV1SDR7_9ROSI|nr:unnamed protein product [Dovyalis caffra]
MANNDLKSPLLPSQPSDPPHLILTVHESDYSIQQSSNNNHSLNPNPNLNTSSRNPFEFLGSDGLSVSAPSTLDPFRNDTPTIEGLYELIKIVICLPIAIARLVLFGVCLVIGYVATKIALHGWKDKHNPMSKWRSRLMWVTRVSARCILFSFGYHWIKRKGKLAPREIAPIVVSNHVIYVDRFSPSSRKHAVNEIKRKASCDRFPRVLLFPEGTTTNGKVLISFQLGAFIPGYAIQPVEYLPIISPLDNCKENPSHFAKRTGHAIASALNVVQTYHSYGDLMLLMKASELKQEKPSSYMVEMAKVESLFHISSLEAVDFLQKFLSMNPDARLLSSYGLLNWYHGRKNLKTVLPSAFNYCNYSTPWQAPAGGILASLELSGETEDCQALFNCSLTCLDPASLCFSILFLLFVKKFLCGRVEFHDFLRAFRLRSCTLTEELFGFLDVEKSGSITFKQYLYGSAHVMKRPLFRQACELAFTECDAGGHNQISEQELGDTIRLAIPDLDGDELHELFNIFDTDGDGFVRKDNFISCLRRNPLLIALFTPCLVHKDSSKVGHGILEEIGVDTVVGFDELDKRESIDE